uniref:Dual specificity protein phosphatase 16 n=1 Tax=Rhabditophanes sp. KR3021 TaxID=114890 RepID=A0AC35U1G9_9BILA
MSIFNSHERCGTKSDGPTEILSYLYLGCQDDASCNKTLKKYNIKAIINITQDCTYPDLNLIKADNFLNIAVTDSFQTKLINYFDQTYQFIERQRKQNHNILIHCLAGISRSATICIAYLMKHYNWDNDTAYSFVKQKRPSISPNFNFLGQLFTYYTNEIKGKPFIEQPPPIIIKKAPSEVVKSTSFLERIHCAAYLKPGIKHFKNGNRKRMYDLDSPPKSCFFNKDCGNLTGRTSSIIQNQDIPSPSTEFAKISIKSYVESKHNFDSDISLPRAIDNNNTCFQTNPIFDMKTDRPLFDKRTKMEDEVLLGYGNNLMSYSDKEINHKLDSRIAFEMDNEIEIRFHQAPQLEQSCLLKSGCDLEKDTKLKNGVDLKKPRTLNLSCGGMLSHWKIPSVTSGTLRHSSSASNCCDNSAGKNLRKGLSLIFKDTKSKGNDFSSPFSPFPPTTQTPTSVKRPMFLDFIKPPPQTPLIPDLPTPTNSGETLRPLKRDPDCDSIGSNSSHEIAVN